jgi:hypothetical protein
MTPLQPETLVETIHIQAGEGNKKERGRSPLSIITPPLKHLKKRWVEIKLFERGTKGKSVWNQP